MQLIAGDGQEVAGVIADPACDMWSLGVIAFHILSGTACLALLPISLWAPRQL